MDESLLRIFERLIERNIEIVPSSDITNHVVFARGDFAALVQRTPSGLGQAGAPGRITTHGFAPLVHRTAGPVFAAKGYEQPATEQEIADLRLFLADLETALAPAR
jgi:hypothetical protein